MGCDSVTVSKENKQQQEPELLDSNTSRCCEPANQRSSGAAGQAEPRTSKAEKKEDAQPHPKEISSKRRPKGSTQSEPCVLARLLAFTGHLTGTSAHLGLHPVRRIVGQSVSESVKTQVGEKRGLTEPSLYSSEPHPRPSIRFAPTHTHQQNVAERRLSVCPSACFERAASSDLN